MVKLTTEQFIEKSRLKHDNKYDYSLTQYTINKNPVKIICPQHGEFEQLASIHLRGSGCLKCRFDNSRSTKREFIDKANIIHNNKFNYSDVNYKTTNTKVNIICEQGHSFLQTPHNHLSGQGCPKCYGHERLTKEQFIIRANKVHENRYNYNEVNYINTYTKVKIICLKHGQFNQIANDHLNGSNCPKCTGREIIRGYNEEFIQRLKQIHGDLYNYSLVNYQGVAEKIDIICSKHGFFRQKASNHLNGGGCPKCIGMYKTTPEFIQECIKVHGNKFNYNNTVYLGSDHKIEITCQNNHKFFQIPKAHLQGKGCPKCNGDMPLTTGDFIEKSIAKHGIRYDYSLVQYIKNSIKVKIICKQHGVFEQRPATHMNGYGCRKCSGRNKTNEEFINECKKIHGENTYDYSLTNFTHCRKKVKIICKIHGEFEQIPGNHRKGGGCLQCSKKKNISKGERSIMDFLNSNKIHFFYQYFFKNCKDKKVLHFDFYLPNHNLCIEYDGQQHYKDNNYFHQTLEEQQFKDNIKNEYCDSNKIKLIRIPYFDFNNIDAILSEELLNKKEPDILSSSNLVPRKLN